MKPTKDELLSLYKEKKLTLDQIAEKFNTSKTSVYKLIKKYEIPINERNRILPPDNEILIDLYEVKHLNMEDIAKQFNVHRITVAKWLKNANIKIDNSKPIPPKNELEYLYITLEKRMLDIGVIYNVNRNLVSKWLESYNIEINPPEKEELERYYVTEKLTLNQISLIYGVSRSTATRWLNKYNIPIKSNVRKFYHLKAIPFTQLQKEFIIGTMLGDGFIGKVGKNSKRITMTHGEKQLNYLLWKKSIMGNFVNNISSYQQGPERNYCVSWRWASITHNEFNFYHKLFYENNKKVVREDIVHYITPFAMAVWVMDDGWKSNNCNIRISSEGFTKEENEILQRAIKVNLNINVKVCEYTRNNKKYYYLSFNKRNSILLTQLISSYVIPTMQYKLIKDLSSTTDTLSIKE